MASKLLLFTVSACPMGRNMGTVMSEVQERHPDLQVDTVYVEADPVLTNQYRVKSNPSLLFLDGNLQELARLEGFHETPVVELLLEQLKNGEIAGVNYEENRESLETYQVFLDQGEQLVAVEVRHLNPTGVKTPRITAVQMLLQADVEGYDNPFPTGTSLDRVEFARDAGRVYLTLTQRIQPQMRDRMQAALQKTLAAYNVPEVELHLQFEGEVEE